MNKVFNSVQTHIIGEDCNKFSKSVSYETLVGGTATIGTEIKQTQRLSEGSADKPLSAVGTLTSLLCNSAKVMEKLFYRHSERSEGSIKSNIKDWILHFANAPLRMTIPVLALILTLITIGEALATKTCDCGTAGHETECCWEITEVTKDGKTEKILTISPGVDTNGNNLTSVVMKDFDAINEKSDNYYTSGYKSSAPWARSNVTSVIVENGISNIGDHAFIGDTQIISVRGMNDVTTIGTSAFHQATSLENIDMPNVKVLGPWSFADAASITSVDMPNIESISYSVFRGATSLNYIGFNPIKLTNENIGSQAFNFSYSSSNDIPLEIWANCDISTGQCGSCGNDYVKSGLGCVSDCGAGYLGKDGRCIDASNGCGAGYRQFENFCNRIRYTPAEAAKVLTDDNNNSVTITFKK